MTADEDSRSRPLSRTAPLFRRHSLTSFKCNIRHEVVASTPLKLVFSILVLIK